MSPVQVLAPLRQCRAPHLFGKVTRMAKHLPGKVARLISDFLTIGELTKLIEHEMEKRIVARHGLVKLERC